MKRLRSSDDVNSFREKGVFKDWGRRDNESSSRRTSSHQSFHYRPENIRRRVSSSFTPRYDQVDDDNDRSRLARKRPDYDLDDYERGMAHDRFREGSHRGILSSSPRDSYVGDRIHPSESFSTPRREIPKGFRSERDRPRREGSVSSWQRFGTGKYIDDGACGRNKVGSEEKGNMYFSQKMREPKSPACSKDSESEQSKTIRMRDSGSEQSKSTKMKDSRNEQLKSTKVKDSGSEQSKSTKMSGSGSEQSKSTKMNGSRSKQSSSTKMKELESEQSRSIKMKDSDSEHSNSTNIRDLESDQSKNTKMQDPGNEQSKSTKMKDSGSEQSKSTKLEDLGCGLSKSTKINDWESEQLKSTKMTKREDLRVKRVNSSEVEEGELESDPESEGTEGNGMLQNNFRCEERADKKMLEDKVKSVSSIELCRDSIGREGRENGVRSLPELKANRDGAHEETLKFESQKSIGDLAKAVDESACSQRNPLRGLAVNEDAAETMLEIGGSNVEEGLAENDSCEKGEIKDDPIEELMPVKEVHEEGKFLNHAIEDADSGYMEPAVCEGVDVLEVSEQVYGISPSFKDKGKSVVISNASASEEEGRKVPTELNHLLKFEPYDMEGPSTRGLDLFLSHPVKQPEKQQLSGFDKPKDEKLELEPFDLSLSLPNVLLPIDSQNRGPVPSSPSHARSIQSIPSTFQINSDGFTASVSFTGSQSFRHNPSCSLANNSMDNFEHSVSSRPLFGGIDKVSAATWLGQPSNEQKQKEFLMYHTSLSNGNGFLIQDKQLKVVEGSSIRSGLDMEFNLQRQMSTNSRQSAGSHDYRSEYSNDKKPVIREKVSVDEQDSQRKAARNIYKNNDQNEEQLVTGGGVDPVEPIITVIVSEPVDVIAKKFNEMNEQAVVRLKKGVRDIIVNAGKQWQLSLFQKALNNRSEITLEMLLKANRCQMEIMVALKTGVIEFLQRNQDISSSDMAEIYLNLRCRNLTCRNLLPVDDCDCKVCAKKNGFCSNCMCLVCSNYDMASNTCSWVGCDVCLHWCHADCALRESYIRNGPSACGTHGLREMQFHCVACNHPSEMFGFVKEVFQTFAKDWTRERLSKELEYVRKIFSASEDMRGIRLHDIAVLMLSRLASKSDFREVQNDIMSFLAESSSTNSDYPTVRSGKELFNRYPEGNTKTHRPIQEPVLLKPLYSEKAPHLEKASSFKTHQNNTIPAKPDLQKSAPNEHAFDELESIVRMKEAEAKMFQTRADDARREAEGLKRIATAKKQRIDEEYANRISKVQLPEVEKMQKQKIKELQGLERARREYFDMKMRMEGDIRDLLSKMEATKRNIAI